VPRQDSTGGKQKLGPISKQGDRYLRRILVVGAHSVLRRAKQNPEKYLWLTQLLAAAALDRCKKRAMVEGPRAQCDTRYCRAWRTDNAAAAGISLSLGREGLIRE
jgi:transposase